MDSGIFVLGLLQERDHGPGGLVVRCIYSAPFERIRLDDYRLCRWGNNLVSDGNHLVTGTRALVDKFDSRQLAPFSVPIFAALLASMYLL